MNRPARHAPLSPIAALVAFVVAIGGVSPLAHAQQSFTLDGTSGSNSISTSYTTTGGLTLTNGFFFDYLVVGGGDFGGGDVNGQAMVLTVAVPEPATYAMAFAGIACGGYLASRRRRRAGLASASAGFPAPNSFA